METQNLTENQSAAFHKGYTNENLDICHPFINAVIEVTVIPAFLVVVAAGNILLAVSAIILNTLVHVAVRRNNSLRLPSKILLSSLLLTDLGTGIFTQPVYAAHLLAKATNSGHLTCLFYRFFIPSFILLGAASIFTMTAISLDRFTAFFFHLKYREIVTTRRVCFFLAILWSGSSVFASSYFQKSTMNRYITICALSLCLSTITVAYTKIYRGLRRHHGHQVQDQAQAQAAATALDVAKYRRTASSMMWIYGLFLFCYVPHSCNLLLITHTRYYSLSEFTTTLVLLNSSLNPLVYCFRLPEIRLEITKTVRKILRKNP